MNTLNTLNTSLQYECSPMRIRNCQSSSLSLCLSFLSFIAAAAGRRQTGFFWSPSLGFAFPHFHNFHLRNISCLKLSVKNSLDSITENVEQSFDTKLKSQHNLFPQLIMVYGSVLFGN